MGFRLFATVFVLALGAACFAGDGGPALDKPTPPAESSTKQSELKWARGVAADFLAAWIGGNNAEAEMLLTAELKARYERSPSVRHWPPGFWTCNMRG